MQILVVDDDGATRMVLERMLDKLGHTPVVVSDAVQALGILGGGEFRVILTDWLMPQMCGHDFIHAVRAGLAGDHHKNIPIIVITADVMRVNRDICRLAGATAMLPKPLVLQDLVDILQTV